MGEEVKLEEEEEKRENTDEDVSGSFRGNSLTSGIPGKSAT